MTLRTSSHGLGYDKVKRAKKFRMSNSTDPVTRTNWGDLDREHQIRTGLAMTPAERLRWLEDTVEELRPWVGLASDRPGRDWSRAAGKK